MIKKVIMFLTFGLITVLAKWTQDSEAQEKKEEKMKPILWSKTFWVNMVVIVVAGLTGVLNCEVVTAYPVVVTAVTGAVGVINILLRLVTKVPVK